MIYYIDDINSSNWITWRCKIWDLEEEAESNVFLKLYKEYTDKEFPVIKTKGKHILFEYDFKAITKELLEELKVLRLYRKDKRIDNLLYLINSFIGDIECKHYVFNIIEEGN